MKLRFSNYKSWKELYIPSQSHLLIGLSGGWRHSFIALVGLIIIEIYFPVDLGILNSKGVQYPQTLTPVLSDPQASDSDLGATHVAPWKVNFCLFSLSLKGPLQFYLTERSHGAGWRDDFCWGSTKNHGFWRPIFLPNQNVHGINKCHQSL